MNAKTSPVALATVEHPQAMRPAERAFEPTSIEEAWRLSKILVAGNMMPRHLKTPEAVFSVIAAGRELGLTSLQSTRSLYFIEGKVVLSADLMVALVKRHPECEHFTMTECTNDRVTCTTKRTGEEATSMTWTMADAQRAGLTGKDNWKKYPKAMLRARVSADLCRAVFPDALMGVYDPDELQREPPARVAPPVVVRDPDVAMTHPDEEEPRALAEALRKNDAVDPPAPDAEDEAKAEMATEFAGRIFVCQSTAELLDLKQEIKRADLGEILTLPLSEQFTRRKKELAAAEKLAAEA